MADIQLLLKLGKELDLSGQELWDWVDRKAAEQKEERAAQIARDEQKEALQIARQERADQSAREERAAQIARDERAAERELKKLS